MSSKPVSNLIVVGVLKGAHGVRGDVRVKSFTADPQDCFAYGALLDETGETLLTPRNVRATKDHFIVSPSRPRQKEAWDTLRGAFLYVPRDAFPETEEDEFYITDLVGLDVYGGGDEKRGQIKAVQNYGADDLLEIQPFTGEKSIFVPFTRVDVPTVNIASKRVIIPDFELWAAQTAAGEAPKDS